MFREIFHLDGAERPEAEVEGDRDDPYSLLLDACNEPFREVKTGGRGSHRTDMLRIDGLVGLFILLDRLALDVVGKRRDTDPLDDLKQVVLVIETDSPA